MHATLGQAGLLGNASHALGPVVTKTLENPQAFVPKSHVGLVLQRVAELSPEFSSSAYMTDTSLSRLKRIPQCAAPQPPCRVLSQIFVCRRFGGRRPGRWGN